MIKEFSRCAVSVLIMILLSPVFSFAGNQVPYRDRVEAEIVDATPVSANEVLLGFVVHRGQGTLVGRFTTEGELLVNTNTFEFTGTNTLTAANGDQIFIEITGMLTPTADPEAFIISVETEFVGGTGRFENVTGGFTGEGSLHLGPGGAFVGATFNGVGVGTISSPGKNN